MSTEADLRELALALPATTERPFRHVLVRLARVDREESADLLEDAWRVRAPQTLVEECDAG